MNETLPLPSDPAEQLRTLLAEVGSVLDAIRAKHRALASAPEPESTTEEELLQLVVRRKKLGQDLAQAAVAVLARGGTVLVHPVQEVPPPVPAVPAPKPESPPAALGPQEPRPVRQELQRLPALSLPRAPRPRDLRGQLEAIGKPTPLHEGAEAQALLLRLLAASQVLDDWLTYSPEIQQGLMGLVSALARHLQDESELTLPAPFRDELQNLFPALTHWSKLYRPGFVPGLSRRFGPSCGSWLDDAVFWWEQLQQRAQPPSARELVLRVAPAVSEPVREVAHSRPPESEGPEGPLEAARALAEVERAAQDPAAELGPKVLAAVDAGIGQRHPRLLLALRGHLHRLADVPGLKTLKTALKSASRPDPVEEELLEEASTLDLPSNWPHLAMTEGKRAVVVGGDPRPAAAERMRAAFRFARVDWEAKDARRLQGLAERVRGGSIDLVLLLRAFVGHAEASTVIEACRGGGVPFVIIDTGYGVSQVRLALERFAGD